MKYKKRDYPVKLARRFIEPGPVILISSRYRDRTNIMTCGWHIVLEFEPSLVACYIWDQDRSHDMIRKSKECVINIPTVDLAKEVVGIGNTHGDEVDKFSHFGLTPKKASKVKAPLIDECYANLECKLVDSKLIKNYSLFIFEVVKIHTATKPKNPKTMHYMGRGEFMTAGRTLNLAKYFKPEMLGP